MTREQYERLENELIEAAEYVFEKTTANEAGNLLAAVQALATLADVRQLIQDGQQGSK